MSAPADRALRVAIVGAGPAGIYTADALTFDTGGVQVDLLERLPEPFGLLRFGVAPDHLSIKSAAASLQEVLDRPTVRLFTGVEVGTQVMVDDLRKRYDAVVYATGADADRALQVPGEDLAGSTSATEFVKWYNGHPEATDFDLSSTRSVVVVGAGNVALDVTRILLKDPAALRDALVPPHVADALRASAVTAVHLLARRGPEHAKFSSKELGEIGALEGVDVIVDPSQLPAEPPAGTPPMAKRNLALLSRWADAGLPVSARRAHLHFHTRPVAVEGVNSVRAVRVVRGTDQAEGFLDADLVLRSVGYRSRAIDGIPFSAVTATIPHDEHRVVRDGHPSLGEYAVGWAKRGPTGILGRNRSDAEDTAQSVLADRERLLAVRSDVPDGIDDLLG